MTFNRGFIYFLLGLASLAPASKSAEKPGVKTVPGAPTPKYAGAQISMQAPILVYNMSEYIKDLDAAENQILLDEKAGALCDAYVANMVQSQQKLRPLLGTNGYYTAVRNELPGAPVYSHCMYGQYTHLTRAIQENGDTLTIIPNHAGKACKDFKQEMKRQYQSAEFRGCLHQGKMFASDTLYKVAMNKYLARHKITAASPDSVKMTMAEKFATTNFSIDDVAPGSILIVPRYHGASDAFHAIMYLGRGYVNNGTFVKDNAGIPVYAGHNREIVGDLFRSYDTSDVFAVDTKKIVRIKYAQELSRIESMQRDEIIKFLESRIQDVDLLTIQSMTHQELLQLARATYFRKTYEKPLAMRRFIAAQTALKNARREQWHNTI